MLLSSAGFPRDASLGTLSGSLGAILRYRSGQSALVHPLCAKNQTTHSNKEQMTNLLDILGLNYINQESNDPLIKQEVYDPIEAQSVEFQGVSGITTQGNPTLVYLLPSDNSLCYKFCQKRANGATKKVSSYYCVGCKSKGKNISIYVSGDTFMDNPTELLHLCQPKTTSKELAAAVANEHLASIATTNEKKKPRACYDDLLELCQKESKIPENIRNAVVETVAEGGHRQRRRAYSRRINKFQENTQTHGCEDCSEHMNTSGFKLTEENDSINNLNNLIPSTSITILETDAIELNQLLNREVEVKKIKLEINS